MDLSSNDVELPQIYLRAAKTVLTYEAGAAPEQIAEKLSSLLIDATNILRRQGIRLNPRS